MGLKGGVSAMELFPRRPSTILDELTKLENMMPAYKEELFKVSKFIRRRFLKLNLKTTEESNDGKI